MGRRKKRENKNQTILYLIVVFVFAVLSALGLNVSGLSESSEGVLSTSNINIVSMEDLEDITIKTGERITQDFISENAENLKVYFFDVGQADSILITNQDKTMLIDAGNNEDGKLLVQNLKDLQIQKIDYLIGTHPHEDHIGGMDDIIKNFDIGTIYMPKVQTNTKTFEDVIDAVKEKELKIETPKIGDSFSIGKAECKVLSVGTNKENLNLSSIVIKLDFEELSYLFTGDMEEEIENKLNVDKINILKVAHHGSDTSSSENFINKIAPELAIISVGKDNSYGHPSEQTIDRLKNIGTTIYRTDEVGNIMIEQKCKNSEN